jgi:hypothetical protein
MFLNFLTKTLRLSSSAYPHDSGRLGAAPSTPGRADPIFSRVRTGRWAALFALAACGLTGCVTSTSPILGDARAILGDRIQVYAFGPAKDGARTHSSGIFEWSGSRYIGSAGEFSDFTAHPYEGRDLIIQSRPSRGPRITQYGLARRIAENVYLIIPINEDDADEGTRERFCTKTQDAPCRVTTPEQLFVFARATAAKDEETGGIAVVLPAPRR